MEWNTLEPEVKKLNSGLHALMQRVAKLSADNPSYPQPSPAFHAIKNSLENISYDVVVCGEIKKGKSTLLNAIIGQEILPTDTNVATSQVFRISKSETESFALVFSDGTSQPITREELSKYGSQVEANIRGGNEVDDKLLSYIQVNVPLEFLPDNVSLVDTPGLGSVYKSHEWITNSYIKRASAVLFLFDTKPMIEMEKQFINKILDVTDQVMFVMNKIDMENKQDREQVRQRTQDGLNEIFEARGKKAPEILPMSAKMLKDAAEETDQEFKADNLDLSLFPKVKDELMLMIMRTIATKHTNVAIYECQNQLLKIKQYISKIYEATKAETVDSNANYQQELNDLKRKLAAQWEECTKEVNSVSQKIAEVCNSIKPKFSQIFNSTGSIYTHYENRIDNLENMDQVKALCEEMPRSVSDDVAQQWENISGEAQDEVNSYVNVAMSGLDRATLVDTNLDTSIKPVSFSSGEHLNNLRSIIGSGMMGATAGAIWGNAIIAFPPLAIIGAVGAAVWAWLAGKDAELKKNKVHLKQELNKYMQKLRSQFIDIPQGKHKSPVGEFASDLLTKAKESIENYRDLREKEMKQQLQEFINSAKLDAEAKKKKFELAEKELKGLNANDGPIVKLGQLIKLKEHIQEQIGR